MKALIQFLSALLILSMSCFAPSPANAQFLKSYADETQLLKRNASAGHELQIQNSTRHLYGPLANYSDGHTRFQTFVDSLVMLNDSVQRVYTSFDNNIYYDLLIRGSKASIYLQEGINTGGLVSYSGTGLIYNITASTFTINQQQYSAAAGSVTLSAGDATFDRYDVIVVNSDGTYSVVEGDPDANPAIPQIDEDTQIALMIVNVTTGATMPSSAPGVVYDENTEWTATATGVSVNFNNTSNVYQGSKSADVGSWTNNQTFKFSTAVTPITASQYTLINLHIKLKAALVTGAQIRIRLNNSSSAAVTNTLTLGAAHGFTRTLTTYQTIVIPLTAFTFTGTTYSQVQILFSGTGTGAYFDYINLQNDLQQNFSEKDPVAIAKTVTVTGSADVPVTGAAQTLNANPSFTLGNVAGLRGSALPSLSAGNLKYTGSAWSFDNTTYATRSSFSATSPVLYNSTTGVFSLDTSTTAGGWHSTGYYDGRYAPIGGGGGGLSGSGTAGQAAFWNGTSSLSGDNAYTWDNTNKRLNLGTENAFSSFQVGGINIDSSKSAQGGLYFIGSKNANPYQRALKMYWQDTVTFRVEVGSRNAAGGIMGKALMLSSNYQMYLEAGQTLNLYGYNLALNGANAITANMPIFINNSTYGQSYVQFNGNAAADLTFNARYHTGAGQEFRITGHGAQTSSTNANGGTLILSGGISTGTGTSSITFKTASAGSSGTTDNTPGTKMTVNAYGLAMGSRIMKAKGADIASANDLTLGNDGNVFAITGTSQINAITTTNWQAGSTITLIFSASVTVKNNTAGGGGTAALLLNGGADFSATANDVLTLVYNGTNWLEVSRAVN